ncbi:MAG: ribokinase [Dehalococcoidales bacterium]|nr:ribokinase [Dehalococcoidales bacterium]
MGRVLVFGSINTDLVTYVETLPVPGETMTGGRFETFPGGKGANQAVAAARAGAAVEMYGCVGDDAPGRDRLTSLEEAGVSARNVTVKKGIHSGIAQIIVDRHGENLIAVTPGANFLFGPDDVTFPEHSPDEKVVSLFQNEVPQASTEAIIRECKKRRMTVLWNMAPACQERPAGETLRAVEYLICNQPELRAIVGDGENEALANELLQWGVANVLVTLGKKGALLVTNHETYHQEAFPVSVVDTVGTGDCFCGVFACSLSFGIPVKEALRRASAAAALSAGVRGAQTSMPTAAEVDRFLSNPDSV